MCLLSKQEETAAMRGGGGGGGWGEVVMQAEFAVGRTLGRVVII